MKKVLFVLCFLPLLAFAQRQEWEEAWKRACPDSLGSRLDLPQEKFFSRVHRFSGFSGVSEYNYAVTSDSVFRLIFSDLPADSLPVIDFTRKSLVVFVACPQCLATCHHVLGRRIPCHRNACTFREAWYLVDRKKLPD